MRRHRLIASAAGVLAVAALCAGLRWGAMVAGGADSYGYVSQAGYWQRGGVAVEEGLSLGRRLATGHLRTGRTRSSRSMRRACRC
jgi:hypothetical protein